MAESIFLHICCASAQDVLGRIAAMTQKAGDGNSYSYPPSGEYLLLITIDPEYDSEYDNSELAEIERMLGARPNITLIFELRRSQSDAACDAAVAILRRLSTEFAVVVSDCDRFWTATEALSSSFFLDQYRYTKRA